MPVRKTAAAAKIADDYTNDEIDLHEEKTLGFIANADKEWVGMVKLPVSDKAGNVGKLLTRLGEPLGALFDALVPHEGDDPNKQAAKTRLAAVFDSMLGAQDRGKDPARFEVELLARRLRRAEAELRIAAALEEARQRFADDAMNTGEMVIEPGLRALEVARTAASTNPEFRSLLAPVLDKLGDMTKKARQYQDEARKVAEKVAEKPENKANGASNNG